MSCEPSFLITLKDFSDCSSNLESLASKPRLFKELMQQMKYCHQVFLQRNVV